jgi:hypothetical protein
MLEKFVHVVRLEAFNVMGKEGGQCRIFDSNSSLWFLGNKTNPCSL